MPQLSRNMGRVNGLKRRIKFKASTFKINVLNYPLIEYIRKIIYDLQ